MLLELELQIFHHIRTRIYLYFPSQLTSLIYAGKFEFENPTIMEAKQCKQTEQFSVMAKETIFCHLMINPNKDIM